MDTIWKFDNIQLSENKRPIEMREGSFKLETKDEIDYLVGNISFYSETTKEYTRPNYVVLKRNTDFSSISKSEIIDNLAEYDNVIMPCI